MNREYLYIGCGGFLGAVLRFLVKEMPLYQGCPSLITGTLIANLLGSFAMAFILTTVLEIGSFDPDIKLGVTTGFLGAFTTFSTLCKETVGVMYGGDYLHGVSYLGVSVVTGFFSAYLGIMVARRLGGRLS